MEFKNYNDFCRLIIAAQQLLKIPKKVQIIQLVDGVSFYRPAANLFNMRHPERSPVGYSTVASCKIDHLLTPD